MATFLVVQQALDTWRDAERLLAELPADSPDYEAVSRALGQARDTYHALMESEPTALVLAQSAAIIADARSILRIVPRAQRPLEQTVDKLR